MSPGPPGSYRQEVPTALRSRRLLGALAALLLAGGLVAAAIPDGSELRADVGTEGDGADPQDRRPEATLPTWAPGDPEAPGAIDDGDEDDEAVESDDGTPTTRAVRPSRSATTTTSRPSSASTTAAPSTSTTVPDPTLRGRLAFLLSDGRSPSSLELWSMKEDGTDLRKEPQACHPGGSFPGSLFDVSPDGRFVARDCGASSGSDPGQGIVIQDLRTGSVQSVHAHAMFASPAVRWSPDGSRLAMTSPWSIAIMTVDDREVHEVLLERTLGSGVVTWAPDQRSLLTEAGQTIDLTTGAVTDHPELATLIPAGAFSGSSSPRWSDDGHLFIQATWTMTFEEQSTGGQHYRLSEYDLTSGTARTILEQGTFAGRVEFLSDGRLSLRDGTDARITIRRDGTGRVAHDHPWGRSGPIGPRGQPGLPTTG